MQIKERDIDIKMKKNNFFACFGGYGDQYWTNIAQPNIRGKCNGLTICLVDGDTGVMKAHSYIEGLESPATLVVSPDNKYIYTANETSDFGKRGYGGGISALSFNLEEGKAKLINQSLSYGAFPAYISIDKTGRYIFIANHGSKLYCSRFEKIDGKLRPKVIRDEGCITMFKVREDGSIGELLDRIVLAGTGIDPVEHASAHPHSILIDEQDFIVVPDKGGDKIYVYKFNRETEKMDFLSCYKAEFGSSPRHVSFVKGTNFILVINEYDGHLCSYSLNRSTGELTPISRLDCGDPTKEYIHQFYGRIMHAWANDVQVHPNGQFVYTNIDQKLLSLFYINRLTGELTLIKQHQIDAGCRGMQIDRDGKFIVATGVMSEKAYVYRIDQTTGELAKTSEIDLPTPTALRFIYPTNNRG